MKTKSVESLFGLMRAFSLAGIGYEFSTQNLADIVLVRNAFASFVAASNQFTHLLFVDNDMCFGPRGVLKMIDASKPVIAWACPKRSLPLKFALKKPRNVRDGLCIVDEIGAGVMLIERQVLTTMIDTGRLRSSPGQVFSTTSTNGKLFGFFDQIDRGDTRLSEDYSFCDRWRRFCGGTIYALIDESIGHIGDFVFEGSFLDHASTQLQSANVDSPQNPE